jgi:hypothetical protein
MREITKKYIVKLWEELTQEEQKEQKEKYHEQIFSYIQTIQWEHFLMSIEQIENEYNLFKIKYNFKPHYNGIFLNRAKIIFPDLSYLEYCNAKWEFINYDGECYTVNDEQKEIVNDFMESIKTLLNNEYELDIYDYQCFFDSFEFEYLLECREEL